MKADLKYLLIVFLFTGSLFAQTMPFSLNKGSSQLFKGNLYTYGFSSREKKAVLCIYKLTVQLRITDSLIVSSEKNKADDYLQISSDTLHDFLNIYLQKKEKKLVSILRFNKKFELVANIENVDVARLNSISDFESELLYFKNDVYTIKTQRDSSGLQFYLNKYNIKSELKNFEYIFTWQFPFERKNIRSAHLFYVGKKNVLLYVNVSDAQKPGQWILNINTATGKLVRGTKLNDKGDKSTYAFGAFIADTLNGTFTFVGQKFTEAQLSQQAHKLAIANAPAATIYLAEIDSTGEITHRQDFKIPIVDTKSTAKKSASNYILRMNSLGKSREGKISFAADIFRNSDHTLSFLYANTTIYNIVPQEDEQLLLEKNTISVNPLFDKFYLGSDKLDMNGKLAVDSLDQFEKLFYKTLTYPVKVAFKMDADNNPLWVLLKSNPKKNNLGFFFISPVKKIYQLTLIEEIPVSANPVFINLSKDLFIIPRQVDETTYEIRSFNW